MRYPLVFLGFFIVLLLPPVALANAEGEELQPDRPAAEVKSFLPLVQYQGISEQMAVAIARQYVRGRVLAVDRMQQHGSEIYRVKVLDRQGVVRIVLVDASSGMVLLSR